MHYFLNRRRWLIGGFLFAVIVLLAGVWGNARITAWIESPAFVEMLDRETSKGLKLEGHYSPLQRVGLLGMRGDAFTGTNGSRTIVTLDARELSGSFNPLGIALQRWEIDGIHLKSGTVMLQKTEPIPGAPKGPTPRPWWGWFWPYRVHLADVKVDEANILWRLKDQESGIYRTFLEVTPNGRDFEYDARGGEFRTPMSPPLFVRHAHVLVRKPKLDCGEFILGDDDAHPEEQLRLTGEAGLQDDRFMRVKVAWTALKLAPWLPAKFRAHMTGHTSGEIEYASTGTGLETAQAGGRLEITDAVLKSLAPVHRYAVLTGSPDPGDLPLKVCRAEVKYDQGAMKLEGIEVESEGVFRLTGRLTVGKDGELDGELQLGLAERYLRWLPTATTAIFTRTEGPYHFAPIHLTGTMKKPVQDLSARVAKEVEKSPLIALKLFFNQAGDWFDLD